MLMYVRITKKMCFFIVSSYRYDVTTVNAVIGKIVEHLLRTNAISTVPDLSASGRVDMLTRQVAAVRGAVATGALGCLLYTSPSPRDS